MANNALMTIDGKKSDLKYLRYHFHRHTEDNGKPATRIRKGEITVTKDSIYDKASAITWLGDPDKGKDGEIVIYQDEQKKQALKTIKFKNAYIIEYEETFDLEKPSSNTVETFTISAETIEVENAKFDFIWPESHS
ncbi:type VI secretion system tube protein TssD [Sabulibacter ruber]|uniref:type VI secretion system tube protein TssD n=1 Tax=Sabulibacter ruber TaxID=2811901 RepID=UPI001A96DC29|nr:type VI secretion system tube protein TssD [Sabulibacter ruber]